MKYLVLFSALSLVGCGQKKLGDLTSKSGGIVSGDSSVIVGELNWAEVADLSKSDNARISSSPVAHLSIKEADPNDSRYMFLGRCTGFMVSKKIMMTNEHCIPENRDMFIGIEAKFEYLKGSKLSKVRSYNCSKLIGVDKELDFALVSCDEDNKYGYPGERYGKVKISTADHYERQGVYLIHQNCDHGKDPGCDDYTKKFSPGEVIQGSGFSLDKVNYDADTLGGSSGSPVFDAETDEVFALHHLGIGKAFQGRGLYNEGIPMKKIMAKLKSDFTDSYNEIMNIKKPVDPNNMFIEEDIAIKGATASVREVYKYNIKFDKKKNYKFSIDTVAGVNMWLIDSATGKALDGTNTLQGRDSFKEKLSTDKEYYLLIGSSEGFFGEYEVLME